jgi:cytochrome c-type biogenesis protein CcmH/NrfF
VKLLLLGVLAFAFATATPAFAVTPKTTIAAVEEDLVCPACHEPLDESSSPVAEQMKAYIRQHIAMGWTKKRIENTLEEQPGMGPAIFGVPSDHGFDLLIWLLPIGGIIIGAIALAAGAWVWSRNRGEDGSDPPVASGLDPVMERRVNEALAHFDG